jgi:hypothetical protein
VSVRKVNLYAWLMAVMILTGLFLSLRGPLYLLIALGLFWGVAMLRLAQSSRAEARKHSAYLEGIFVALENLKPVPLEPYGVEPSHDPRPSPRPD